MSAESISDPGGSANPGGAGDELRELVARALAEDVGEGDITAEAVVPEDARATARIVQKAPGVVFGLDAVEEAFRQVGTEGLERLVGEGEWRDEAPVDVARIEGPARGLLAAERTALNLLGRLSGIATLTALYVKAVKGKPVRILDTRKTTAGMRFLEKQAVKAGGGINHRMGLYDAVLIKENHVAVAGDMAEAVRQAVKAQRGKGIAVECRDMNEVRQAIGAGASHLLLDNMDLETLREAATMANFAARVPVAGPSVRVILEASGGITLENVAEVAATGVDAISVGALTHSAPVLDFSMLIGR